MDDYGVTMNHKHKYEISTRWFHLFQEAPGVISPEPCWVLFYDCYAIYDTSLIRLLWTAIKEYKDDKHLAM